MLSADGLYKTYGQLLRYAATGLFMNGLGYLLYVLITLSGLDPKISMTIVYCSGVALNFMLTRGFVFNQPGAGFSSFVQYIFVYFLGYLLNYSLLWFFSERIGWNHLIVQAVSIFVVAFFLFLTLKLLVFRQPRKNIGMPK